MKKQYAAPVLQEVTIRTGDICGLSAQPMWTLADNGNDNMQDWGTWKDR